jgi:hypothetical protein
MFAGWRTFLTLAGLGLLAFSLIGWGVAARFAWREAKLAEGIEITATVQSKRIEELEIVEFWHGSGQTKRYRYLTYAFRPDGGQWRSPEVEVSPGVYAQVETGEAIPIEYARSDPGINRPLANREPHRVAIACIGPGVLSVIALALLRSAWVRAGRELGQA